LKLSARTIDDISDAICGADAGWDGYKWTDFPYRTGGELSRFFEACDLPDRHDGSTRKYWVKAVLIRLNGEPASSAYLPSAPLLRVIRELFHPAEFEGTGRDRAKAIAVLNASFARDGLEASIAAEGACHIRHIGSGTASDVGQKPRQWTREESARREALSLYLGTHSEDDFIENVLHPAFSQVGFQRIAVTGHRDKSLEFGKDMWMKYRLPTGHFIYFGVQAKKDKLDAAGKSPRGNVTEVLNQVRMMLDHPIFDVEVNKKVLVDHVFVACAGEITKQARSFLVEHLDAQSRRHLIFLDQADVLDMATAAGLRFPEVPGAR
jgi:hypothetical protein